MYQYSVDQGARERQAYFVGIRDAGALHALRPAAADDQVAARQIPGPDDFHSHGSIRQSGAYKAYGVPGDPWTFVIDRKGVVRFRQAGSMLYGELEDAIQTGL
jgi:hypothetical protein